jgi:hypothetical protein
MNQRDERVRVAGSYRAEQAKVFAYVVPRNMH